MAFPQLSSRQQTIILLTIGSLLAGAYGVMRYTPQQKSLTALSKKLEKTQLHIKAPKLPDEPDEDGETLKAKAEDLEGKLTYLQTEVDGYAQTLAPTDSQDVLLKISQAARAANVRFIENVPYIVTRRVVVDSPTAAATKKLSKRQQKKLRKKLRKQKKASGVGAIGAMPKEGELIDRLVNDLDEARPLQKVSVEGNFENLLKFIQSVQSMPWQVTIVKLDINVNIQTPAQGMPQPLMAKMIIGM